MILQDILSLMSGFKRARPSEALSYRELNMVCQK